MPDATEAVIPKIETITPRTAIILDVVFILNFSVEGQVKVGGLI